MAKKILKVKNLKKVYDSGKVKTIAVNGVDFEIFEGDFVALSGPSGSGKSTILYQLGLLDFPTKGKIILDKFNILKLNDKERNLFRLNKIGYVFQRYELLPELTAFENVILPLMSQDKTYEELKEICLHMLKILGLEERLNHFPNELSGGEQQRVAIARALAINPKIILADEPTANLDSVAGKKIMEIFKMLNKKYKKTILVVNHEKEFEKYFNKIIRIKDGKVIKIEKKKR